MGGCWRVLGLVVVVEMEVEVEVGMEEVGLFRVVLLGESREAMCGRRKKKIRYTYRPNETGRHISSIPPQKVHS